MKSELTSNFFRGNRKQLRTLLPNKSPIVIAANGMLQRNGDTTFPFKQDSNFWYLTGVNLADAVLVIDGDTEYLIIPEQKAHQTIFDGPIIEELISQTSGINDILTSNEGWKRLAVGLKRSKQVTVMGAPEAYMDFYGFYTNPARAALNSKIKNLNPDIEMHDLRPQLTAMRMVKQPEELSTIKQAISITLKGIEAVRQNLESYLYEFEIEADLTSAYRKSGSPSHAFHPIVAAGINACTIHYLANNASLSNAGFVLIDTGAELNEYASDIGSTYWLREKTDREADVYAAVISVQKYAYSLLKPGIFMREYEKQIEHYMGEKLMELGLITSLEKEAIRRYFPHAVSHHVGLDAHDAADYDKPLAAGMILAVEPGIYIPEETIGVRVENNVLITADGIQILSSGLVQ